jgi:pectate lyase C
MYQTKWILSTALCALATTTSCALQMDEGEEGDYEQVAAELTNNAVYTLRGVHSGLCLDLENGSGANGANIRLWTCNGATAQQFRFESNSSGYFQIRNMASNKCLDVWAWSTADGANIAQYDCHGGDNQRFSVPDVRSGGVVRVVSRLSGKALDAYGWGTTPGTNIVQWRITGGDNQHFVATRLGDSSSTTSSGTTSSGTTSSGTTSSAGCSTVGSTVTVNETIRVSGSVYDGGCRRFRAGSALGDGSQSESQLPIFRMESGSTLRNVVIGSPAADGVHTYGNVTLENITWEDVGEDALTVKGSGTVTLNGGSARAASDKIFQVNAASTFRVLNFRATDAGKMIRQNGGTTFRVDVFIDRCDISNMDEAIFRTDSSSSTVTMTNTRYSDIGGTLFMGVSSSNITTSNNTEY